ncbi:MAG: GntR family transcriptional regulator [Clostridiales bacterium]|nr:GntR family transcriptional regulator [Clostridiales bacterium]
MFQLNFASRTPIYEQLYFEVVKLASAGVLKPGDKLPPVRTLATQLGVNPNTVAKAYKILESDGYICSVVGKGSFLSDKLSEITAQKFMALEEVKKSAVNAFKLGLSEEEIIEKVKNSIEGGNGND